MATNRISSEYQVRDLEAQNKHLLNMRLYALWGNQEFKEHRTLSSTLQALSHELDSISSENARLHTDLLGRKQELHQWEQRLLSSLPRHRSPMHMPTRNRIDDLSRLNITLENEIKKVYQGPLNDFSALETKTRDIRASNKNLKAEIQRVSEILSHLVTQNNHLKSEIQDINSKIQAVQNHLRNKGLSSRQESVIPPNNAPVNESSAQEDLQLPIHGQGKSKYLENQDFVKDNEKATCPICMETLTNKNNGKIMVTPCGHRFHESCIYDVLRYKNGSAPCPLCKTIFTDHSLTPQTNWDNNKRLYSCFNINF